MVTLSPDTEALIRAKAANAGKTPDEFIREALSTSGETIPGGGPPAVRQSLRRKRSSRNST